MIALLFSLLPAFAQEASCPDVGGFLLDAEGEVARYYLADANRSLASAVGAWACSGPAEAPQLARWFLTDGTLQLLQETPDEAAARHRYAAARELAPDTWTADFGDDARAIWEGSARPEGPAGKLGLRNLGDGEVIWVDGSERSLPLKLTPGPHLLQVGSEGQARFARVVEVEPGQELAVALDVLKTAPPPVARVEAPPQERTPARSGRRKGRFVAAVVSASVGVALYGSAVGVRQAYQQSASDGLFYTTNGLYFGSIAAGTTAGVFGVWALATPRG